MTIGQCISNCMGHSGGDRCFICHGPQYVDQGRLATSYRCGYRRAGLVASPAVTRKGIQSVSCS